MPQISVSRLLLSRENIDDVHQGLALLHGWIGVALRIGIGRRDDEHDARTDR